MEKEVEKEKNIIIMDNLYIKGNISMEIRFKIVNNNKIKN